MKQVILYPLSRRISLFLRDCLYVVTGVLAFTFPPKTPRIVVYCYHSIGLDTSRYTVTEENFKSQIEYLLEVATPLSAQELLAYVRGELNLLRDAFVITFDDGYESLLCIKDYLKEKGIKPIAFILGSPHEANRKELNNSLPLLTPEQILQLHSDGWTIGSHSNTHPNFDGLTAESLHAEVVDSKLAIEKVTSSPVDYFAYPKGRYNSEVLRTAMESRYLLEFSMNDGEISPGGDQRIIPRVGVNGSHSLSQFKHLASPWTMSVRRFVRKIL